MTEERYRQNPRIAERLVDDAIFLAGADNESLYHLNPIAAALWRLLEEPTSVGEAAAIIHEAFPDVAKAKIKKDIAALVTDLSANGLIVPQKE